MRGSVDRIENGIAVLVWDNGKIENIKNAFLSEGDRVIKKRGIIRKVDNSFEKKEMSDLQDKILRKRD